MAPRPPELVDELVEEVLRLPPGDPTSLLRAALVWCRLVSDPGFRRRFRWAPAHPQLAQNLVFLFHAYLQTRNDHLDKLHLNCIVFIGWHALHQYQTTSNI